MTPLGLGDQIRPGSSRPVHFDYVPDLSGFGKSTMPRPDMPLSRECFIEAVILCPGAFVPNLVQNASGYYFLDPNVYGTTRIPENITTMFTSVSNNSSVAGIFDLQYRTWAPFKNPLFDNNRPYTRGRFVHVDSLLSREGLVAIEGLVADMTSGGIGFRNHTAPVGTAYGAEWTEHILWVEPEVSCANTNLSVVLTLGDLKLSSDIVDSVQVVDDGGFARLRHGDPEWLNLTYSSPNVRLRAETTAWASNIFTAMSLNITDGAHAPYGFNVTEGHHYPISKSNTWDIDSLGILNVNLDRGWLNVPAVKRNKNGSFTAGNRTIESANEDPYLWAAGMFGILEDFCNLMNLHKMKYWEQNVECNYLLASPRRTDSDVPYEEVGSQWKSSVFVCPVAVKALIKTATFRVNGTESRQSLGVRSVLDKTYATPADHPLWAAEDWRYPGSFGSYLQPVWGIVDTSFEGTKGYNVTRAPSFYLPYAGSWVLKDTGPDALAGTVAPYAVLRYVLKSAFKKFSGLKSNLPRYSGSDNAVLQNKWRNFSSNSDVESIIRLIWTDMMASIVVGTNRNPPQLATVFDRRVTYDWRYAVPAILFLVSWTLLFIAGFALGVYDRKLVPNLKQLLNNTSVGRVAVSMTSGDHKHLWQASTKDWTNSAGHVPIRFGEDSWEASSFEPVSSSTGQQKGCGLTAP